MIPRILALALLFSGVLSSQGDDLFTWAPLPDLPSSLGVAGPFTGVHDDVLLVGGGANFPKPVWDNDKVWYDTIYALSLKEKDATWRTVGKLPKPCGYGTTVSVPEGVICIGGNDATQLFSEVFLLQYNGENISTEALPSLPGALCYCSGALVGNFIYIAGGQTGPGLETATKTFLRLDWSKRSDPEKFTWQTVSPWPGPARAFCSLVTQPGMDASSLYLVGGRRLNDAGEIEFLSDLYQFDPGDSASPWKKKANLPKPIAAGTVVPFGRNRLVVAGGADGSLFARSDELKDKHPGFPKEILVYSTKQDRWIEGGQMPLNQVTTEAITWKRGFIVASGEVRPRVRTPKVWLVSPKRKKKQSR